MKRSLSLAMALALLMVSFSACGGTGNTPTTQETASSGETAAESAPAAESAGDTVTLRWLMQGSTEEEINQWRELAEDVSVAHPDIQIDLSMTDWNGYFTKLPTEIAGGNPPDLMFMQVMRAKSYMESSFEPLDSYIAADAEVDIDDFAADVVSGLSVDGTIYALPYDLGPFILFYNIDLFESQGLDVPTGDMDFDAFRTLAQSFTGDGVYGYAMGPKADSVIPFIWSDGGEYFDASGNFVINSPQIVDTVQTLADMQKPGGGSAPLTETGNTTWDRDQFVSGSVGMYINGSWMVTNLKTSSDFRIGATVVPAGKASRNTTVAGSGFAVSNESRHKEEAWRALVTLTGKDSQTKLATWGRALPSRSSVRDVFYDMHSDVVGLKEAIELSIVPPIARPYVTPASWQEVQTTFNQNLEAVWLDEEDAQSALDMAQSIIDNVLGQ